MKGLLKKENTCPLAWQKRTSEAGLAIKHGLIRSKPSRGHHLRRLYEKPSTAAWEPRAGGVTAGNDGEHASPVGVADSAAIPRRHAPPAAAHHHAGSRSPTRRATPVDRTTPPYPG